MADVPHLNSDAGLKKLDDYLLTRSYLTGYKASYDDRSVFVSLSNPPSAQYVNTCRWYNHIAALSKISDDHFAERSAVTVEGSAPITEEAVATPPAADSKDSADEDDDDDDDGVDLFGEETEEGKKAAEERAASVKVSTKKKQFLIDIKPWYDETDMEKLEEAVRSIQMEGLFWGASKVVPVGCYGFKNLQIMCTIVDDLVSVDTMIEEKLFSGPINEYVESCDIVDLNKI